MRGTKLRCPYCTAVFQQVVVNSHTLPPLAPALCDACLEVSAWDVDRLRKVTAVELQQIKTSPAWKTMLEPVYNALRRLKAADLELATRKIQ